MAKGSIWNRMAGVMLMGLMVLGGISLLGTVAATGNGNGASNGNGSGGDPEPEFKNITLAERTGVQKLGGGDFVGIYNGDKDAMIGVLYGTDADPNNVYLVSLFTRYLGTADVYESGKLKSSDKPIPVKTLFVQRFGGIYEFDDANGDGMFDSRQVAYNGTNITLRETTYKKLPTNLAWTRSDVTEKDNGNGSKEWTFTLTANDLEYKGPFGLITVDRRDQLETLALTFHLYAETRTVTKTDVPVYRVDVTPKGDGNYNIDDSKSLGNRTYTGQATHLSFKYDTEIKGWDFAARNSNPCLLWTTEVVFANGVSDEVENWIRDQVRNMNGNGTLSFDSDNGTTRLTERNTVREMSSFGNQDDIFNADERPILIRKNTLSIEDNWEKVGKLTWVSDVTVDDTEMQMYFQFYGARRFLIDVDGKGAMAGVAAVGGFSYPGGSKIFHDPTYSCDVFQLSSTGSEVSRKFPVLLAIGAFLLVIVIIAVIAVVVIAKAARSKEASGSGPSGSKDEEDGYYDSYYMDRKKRT